MQYTIKTLTLMVALSASCYAGDNCAAPQPTGPELAGKQIGLLLRAVPALYQTNTMMPMGPLAWSCDYQVGRAQIRLVIAVQVGDPMPCKRKVAFE